MKKKGLIISTVVMAVVLIASLTTATYAWFSAASSASIDQIALNVGAASNVQIGVKKIGATDRTSQASYVSGDVTYTADTSKAWSGVDGLGSLITTGITLDIDGAVGTGDSGNSYKPITEAELADAGTVGEPIVPYIVQVDNAYVWNTEKTWNNLYVVDATNGFVPTTKDTDYSNATTYYVVDSESAILIDPSYNPAHALYSAMGTTYADLNNQAAARVNYVPASDATGDAAKNANVLDLEMGISAAKEGIYGTICTITVKPNQATVGMAAALWADIDVEGTDVTTTGTYDMFAKVTDEAQTKSGSIAHYNSKVADIKKSADGSFTFYFVIDQAGTSQLVKNTADDVTWFNIRLFVSGYDSDSISAATGTSATIDIQFYGVEKDGSGNLTINGTAANTFVENMWNLGSKTIAA